MNNNKIKDEVLKTYAEAAKSSSSSCCGPSAVSCGCGTGELTSEEVSVGLGYSKKDITSVPEGSNMGLGCGNPQAIASLKPGETVLDLGSGGGFDSFLAARQVGKKGYVIGVDMTPEMISKSRINAEKGKYDNVDFRLGEIENLPVADNTIDIIMSNCVINLSPDKKSVYKEAFRVLKPGGRLAISDVVAIKEIPIKLQQNMELYTGCIAGASLIGDLEKILKENGFTQISIKIKNESKDIIENWTDEEELYKYIASASIEAVKP